eukprot:GEZU01021019.1.p1 GENE.GEZU01021019.1~~GEZU01021019.1.p1  ORF type:complete len:358 (+),score=89.05 GEZU01021019.1:60-1133(+)
MKSTTTSQYASSTNDSKKKRKVNVSAAIESNSNNNDAKSNKKHKQIKDDSEDDFEDASSNEAITTKKKANTIAPTKKDHGSDGDSEEEEDADKKEDAHHDKTRKRDHERSVMEAQKKNKAAGVRGKIWVDHLPGRFSGRKWPMKPGFKNVNVCSGAAGIWKQLSPMKLGPIKIGEYLNENQQAKDKGMSAYKVPMPETAQNMENLWQFSKVWRGEFDEKKGIPIKDFFTRRASGWKDNTGHRHVKKGNDPSTGKPYVPLFAWWAGEKLKYIEARRRIYCPIYAREVANTAAFKKLMQMVDDGFNVQILGHDGYNRGTLTWNQCFLDERRPFGHEMVLACLLEGVAPWRQLNENEEDN